MYLKLQNISIRRNLLVFTVLLLGISAGCITQPPNHEIEFHGIAEVQEDGFLMNGTVGIDAGAAPEKNYSGLRAVFYYENGSEMDSVQVGSLHTNASYGPRARSIRYSSERPPAFIVFESPDIWSDEQTDVVALKRDGEEYEPYVVESRDDRFP